MPSDCALGIEHGYVPEEIHWGQSEWGHTPCNTTLVRARDPQSGIPEFLNVLGTLRKDSQERTRYAPRSRARSIPPNW